MKPPVALAATIPATELAKRGGAWTADLPDGTVLAIFDHDPDALACYQWPGAHRAVSYGDPVYPNPDGRIGCAMLLEGDRIGVAYFAGGRLFVARSAFYRIEAPATLSQR